MISPKGAAPDWLGKVMGAEVRKVDVECALLRAADTLTFSELVDLLHDRAGIEPPPWWADWQRWRRGEAPEGPLVDLERQIERGPVVLTVEGGRRLKADRASRGGR